MKVEEIVNYPGVGGLDLTPPRTPNGQYLGTILFTSKHDPCSSYRYFSADAFDELLHRISVFLLRGVIR